MKRLVLFLLIAATMMVSCTKNTDKEAVAKLDALCTSLFPADEPGAAVLVLRGDDIIFDKGYGIADIDTKKPIDGNTFFNIASVSKQFTAVAILQLAELGKLSLEDPVSKYFPEYQADFWKDVKIKHLLSHSSGVPDARGGIPRELKIKGDETLAMSYLPTLDHLNFEPGSAYEYINPTFVLCGAIVEKVSKKPFTQYVTENIFRPAGMLQTLYFDPQHQELIPNMAHG
ncbi:MAG: beta-lactamase family protein, partial [Bacteroidales bacterium]|nr:beta-lactamase family protein [Bacteroidales bacterium]